MILVHRRQETNTRVITRFTHMIHSYDMMPSPIPERSDDVASSGLRQKHDLRERIEENRVRLVKC